jgi:hypothetical protein
MHARVMTQKNYTLYVMLGTVVPNIQTAAPWHLRYSKMLTVGKCMYSALMKHHVVLEILKN